ncbi:hypothetical protein V1517DRAFT_317458 [Lipomyces orientalis]|uniref:Uncharacterized protein n=1 Tax=Lipomyces orientalis TaxID=1233043 RepID=A0ACC3TUK7_9ASCO
MSDTSRSESSSSAALAIEKIDIAPSLPGKSLLRRSNSLNIRAPKPFFSPPTSAPTTPTAASSFEPLSRHSSLRAPTARPSSQLSRVASLRSTVSSEISSSSDSLILSAFQNSSTQSVDQSSSNGMQHRSNNMSSSHIIAKKLEDVVVPGPPMKDVWLREERKKQRKEAIRSSIMWPTKKIFSKRDERESQARPAPSISQPYNVSHVLHLEVQDFFHHSSSQVPTVGSKKKEIAPESYKQRKLPPTPLTPPLTPERHNRSSNVRNTVTAVPVFSTPPSPADSDPRSPSMILPASWRRRSRDSGLGEAGSKVRASASTTPESKKSKVRDSSHVLSPSGLSLPPTPPQRSGCRLSAQSPQKNPPTRPNRPESTWYDDEDKDILEYIMDSYYRRSMSMIYSDVKVQHPEILSNGDRLSLNSRRPSAVTIYDGEDQCLPEVHDIKDLPLQPIPPLRLSSSRLSFESDYSSASSVSSLPVNSPSASPVPVKVQRTMMNMNTPSRSYVNAPIPPRMQSLKYSAKCMMRHERRISEEPDDFSTYDSRPSTKSTVDRRVSKERVGYESPVLGTAAFL